MRPLVCAIILSATTILTAQVPDSLKFMSIGPREFNESFHKEKNGLLIDVREFFEYRKSRIKNAVNIPSFGNLEFAADTIGKECSLFFYCTTGVRSKRVSRFFNEKGFIHIYNLDGGIVAWRKEKLPVEKKKVKR